MAVDRPYLYKNRTDAGRRLVGELSAYKGRNDVLVLALPRGGAPVGFEVAKALGAPLDVFLVRKLGVPGHEEYAMGAIASGGVRVLNDDAVRTLGISQRQIDEVTDKERRELDRRARAYRGDRPAPEIKGRRVILVDDGLATGSTMKAAVTALRNHEPAEIIVAVPTAPPDTCAAFETQADKVICAETPSPFRAVGAWYEDFSQTTDDEVRDYLKLAETLPRPE